MPIFEVHVHIKPDPEVLRRLDVAMRKLDLIVQRTDSIMIDTKKILEAATRSTTDNASLRALMRDTKTSLEKSIADLAAAIAANDPVAMAAAQKDIDDATALLDTDNAETKAALNANIPPSA